MLMLLSPMPPFSLSSDFLSRYFRFRHVAPYCAIIILFAELLLIYATIFRRRFLLPMPCRCFFAADALMLMPYAVANNARHYLFITPCLRHDADCFLRLSLLIDYAAADDAAPPLSSLMLFTPPFILMPRCSYADMFFADDAACR